MRTLAGLNAHLHFAHLSKSSCGSLNSAFTKAASGNSTLAPFSCHQEGISDLMKKFGLSLDQICLLDPKAEHMLSPEDGDGRFVWFLFGVCGLKVIFSLQIAQICEGYIRYGLQDLGYLIELTYLTWKVTILLETGPLNFEFKDFLHDI